MTILLLSFEYVDFISPIANVGKGKASQEISKTKAEIREGAKTMMAEMGWGGGGERGWEEVFPTTAKRVVFYAYYCSIKNNNSTCVRLQILENGSALYRIKNRQHRVHTVNNYIISFYLCFCSRILTEFKKEKFNCYRNT